MIDEEQARKAFAVHLRSIADQLDSGDIEDAALVLPSGWSGVVKRPQSMQNMLFDAMCAMQQMGRALKEQEMRKVAPRIVVPPAGVGGLKLN